MHKLPFVNPENENRLTGMIRSYYGGLLCCYLCKFYTVQTREVNHCQYTQPDSLCNSLSPQSQHRIIRYFESLHHASIKSQSVSVQWRTMLVLTELPLNHLMLGVGMPVTSQVNVAVAVMDDITLMVWDANAGRTISQRDIIKDRKTKHH